MKKLLFFLFIIILQTYGVTNLFGNSFKPKYSSVSHTSTIKNYKSTLRDEEQNIFLLEESDVDFEEEFHDKNLNNLEDTNILENHNYFINTWVNFNSILFILNYHNNSFSNFRSFFVFSNPIYISIQVLRI
jgi:hypothetical protein